MNGYVGLFFDVLTLGALGAVIYYSLRLSKQFNQMQADRKAFEQLISALNVASSRAEAAIRTLKEAALAGGDSLQDKINKARTLSDELEIMIQAGDSLADRLSSTAEKTRKPQPETSAQEGAAPRTRAEKELLEAIRAKQQS